MKFKRNTESYAHNCKRLEQDNKSLQLSVQTLEETVTIMEQEKNTFESKLKEYSDSVSMHVDTLTKQTKLFENYKRLAESTVALSRNRQSVCTSSQTEKLSVDLLDLDSSEAIQSLIENYAHAIYDISVKKVNVKKFDKFEHASNKFDEQLCRRIMHDRLKHIKKERKQEEKQDS